MEGKDKESLSIVNSYKISLYQLCYLSTLYSYHIYIVVFLFENEMLKEEIHIDSMELKYIEEE